MVDDIAERRYQAALADLESKIATASMAEQVHRNLRDRLDSGEPVPDEELAAAEEIARQTARDAAVAEGVAKAYRETLSETSAATEPPRARMRVMSAAAMLGWRQHVLSMKPEVARHKKLDPFRPPMIGAEEV
jgi:hypothetical protein